MTDTYTLNAIRDIVALDIPYRLRLISIKAILDAEPIPVEESDEVAQWTTTLSPAELRTAKENLELVSRADKLLVEWQRILDDWKKIHPTDTLEMRQRANVAITVWSRAISDLKGIVQ